MQSITTQTLISFVIHPMFVVTAIAQVYNAVPLPGPPGFNYTYVQKINNVGQAIGFANDAAYNSYSIIWNESSPSILSESVYDSLEGLNDLGVIVGQGKYWQNVWGSSGYSNTVFGRLYAINDAGVVVGDAQQAFGSPTFAISWSGPSAATQTTLAKLGGALYGNSTAVAINAAGTVIVGDTSFTNNTTHATQWSGSVVTDLGNLGGANASASAINNSNQIVGSADLINGHYHAILWSGGKKNDLGTLGGANSAATWINNGGTIVGTADTTAGATHAALFAGGKVIDLNSVVSPPLPSNVTLTDAEGINDDGSIVANALDNQSGYSFGYVLKPQQSQPPPNSVPSDYAGDTAMGTNSLGNLQYGASNDTGAGAYALAANTTGTSNTALGASALRLNTTGANNTASGVGALEFNTTGGNNVAQGASALYANNTGSNNVAMGENALAANTTGNGNTAVGGSAIKANATGANNVGIGHNSLYVATGSNNIALGANAGGGLTTGSNNIDIGNTGTGSEAGIIRLGAAGNQTAAFIAGIAGTKLTGSAVYVTSTGQLGVLASSERYKTNIESMRADHKHLAALRPVTFHLKTDPSGPTQFGLIAEEVEKVYPDLVIRDAEGQVQGVRYEELTPILLREVQHQAAQIRLLAQQLSEVKKAISIPIER